MASPTRTSRRPARSRGLSGAISPRRDRMVLPDQHRRRQSQSRRRCGDTDLRSSGGELRRMPLPVQASQRRTVYVGSWSIPVRGLLDHRRKHGAPRRRSDDVVGHPERARAFRLRGSLQAAVGGPATERYLAEGSTVLDFQLSSTPEPAERAVDATVRYLARRRADRPHLPARRAQPDDDPGATRSTRSLASAMSPGRHRTAPILVERAMYASRRASLRPRTAPRS